MHSYCWTSLNLTKIVKNSQCSRRRFMREYNNPRNMNILISSDKRYLNKYKTMLFSLKKYNSEFTVYFLNKNLSSWRMNRFQKYLKKKINCDCIEIKMDEKLFDNLPIHIKRISPETYSRLFAQFYLPEEIDRILWLDADVICLKNIEDTYFKDFEGKSIIGTIDTNEEMVKENYQHKIGLDLGNTHHYINAGIIILNLSKMRETTDVQHILDTSIQLKDDIKYQDQDILNVLYKGDMKYVSKYFNYPLFWVSDIEKDEMEKIYFLHYIEAEKPWRIKGNHPLSYLWWDIEKERGNRVKYYLYSFVKGIYMNIRKVFLKIKSK